MKDVPPFKDEEYDCLKNSIVNEGQHLPIIVNPQMEILDGVHRFKACKELKIKVKYEVKKFDDKLQERRFVLTNLLARRHITSYQRYELLKPLIQIEKELAKKRKIKGTLAPYGTKGRVAEKIKRYGFKTRTFQRCQVIDQFGSKKLKERVRAGKVSIAYAEKMIQRSRRKLKTTPPLPKGLFNLFYVDPPWDYDLKLEGAPEYKTMTLEEMKREFQKLPAYKDSVLALWATSPKLKEALSLMEFWGFTFKTKITWVKMKNGKLQLGTGFYVRGADEVLLIGVKGNPGVPAERDRPPSVVFATRTRHSRKPRKFARLLEQMFSHLKKKLELFARERDPDNDGTWIYYGDELDENSKN